MIYDITKPTPPEMPVLGKGLETQKLLLLQTSKDMFQPEHPMLYAPLGAKMSGAEFQYPSGQWLEPCGQISLLCADSGNNKGQHSLLVEAIMREELRSDQEAINKYVEWLTWHGIWSVWAVMGDMLRDGGDTGSAEGGKTGPANMLDSIEGKTFNEQQLDALRQQLGKPTGAASKRQLAVWAARGFIEYSAQTGLYTKTEKYLKGVRS